jgi:hypothetical protein
MGYRYPMHPHVLISPQLQQIAITVKSERRPEERRAVLQNTMAANLNRWQETLDRLEDELVSPLTVSVCPTGLANGHL